MKRLRLLVLSIISLSTLLSAQEADSRASLQELSATLQSELEGHGDRVLGPQVYRWSTRLQQVKDCRADLSIQVTDHYGTSVVRLDQVHFSLAAIEPGDISLKKSWLSLSCARKEKCFFSTSTCSKTTKDGIVVDCASASQKRDDSLALQFDGDSGAAARMEEAFRQAIELCRTPKAVAF